MAQKRTDYSKFTRPSGTIQVLMLWASVALHLAIGSNLGLFGRLDPIKVKPAGGTVRVVDLTPAEQTRVPEAAKSRPLPIAPTPINPEIATRTSNPLPSKNPGASPFVPPRNRPSLPPPSSQLPPIQPVVPTNPNSKRPELSDNSRKKPFSQEGDSESNKGKPSGDNRPRKKKESQTDKDDKSQLGNPESGKDVRDRLDKEKKARQDREDKERREKEQRDQEEKDEIERKNKKKNSFAEEEKQLTTSTFPIIQKYAGKNGKPSELVVPKSFSVSSTCNKYKSFIAFWIVTESIDDKVSEPYFELHFNRDSNQQVNEKLFELGSKIAQEHYRQFRDKSKPFTWYPFKLPNC
jgi:hypothetical protein